MQHRNEKMTPEYLRELADAADHEKLWTLSVFEQLDLPPEKRRQLDTGVALRRHADHVAKLLSLLGTDKSLLMTPLSESGTAITTTRTPAAHRKLAKCRQKATPGPWKTKPHGVVVGGAAISLPRGDVQQQVAMVCTIDDGDRDANARLIAVALDMANALRSLLRHAERVNEVLAQECGGRFVDDGPLSMARDALRMAVGDA